MPAVSLCVCVYFLPWEWMSVPNFKCICKCMRGLTLVVLILFPEEHIHPELSGSVLHSSPSRHGSISHHHFPITMDAVEGEHRYETKQVSLSHRHTFMH